jgi:hypothetical protein
VFSRKLWLKGEIKMRNIIKNHACVICITAILAIGIAVPAFSFFGPLIPSWGSNVAINQNNWWGGFNYAGSQYAANPYAIMPAMGVYLPYNTTFDIYNQSYGYNAYSMGAYNRGYGQQDVNAMGYPVPYAFTNMAGWGNQAGYMGFPPVSSGGNAFNVYYNPGAFTVDLGMDAYYTGINNFWRQVFEDLNEEEDD